MFTANTPPSPLAGSLFFDPERGTVVLLSPYDGYRWEYDGMQWQELPLPDLPNLTDRPWIFVHDAGRQRTVLLRRHLHSVTWETWEHNGDTWTQLELQTAPTAMFHTALAYDAHRQRVVLVTGDYNHWDPPPEPAQLQTWEYDGTGWTQTAQATSPTIDPAFSSPQLAYDPHRQRMVMLLPGETLEVWEYDGRSWVETSPYTAPPLSAHHNSGQSLYYYPAAQGLLHFSASQLWVARYRWDSDWPDEQCDSAADDDQDGLVDCDDPDCANAPACTMALAQ